MTSQQSNLRLDKALGLDPQIGSRSRAEQLLAESRVLVNGQIQKSSYRIQGHEKIEIELPPPVSSNLIPLDLPIDVLFEDQDLIVLNKPAGVVVHPAVGHAQDTLVNMLLAHTDELSMGFHEHRPGIVHRLDRDTSGVLVVAKNNETHQVLSEKFQKRDLVRVYHAVCIGSLRPQTGTIQSYLGRHPTDRKRFSSRINDKKQMIREPGLQIDSGRWSVTNYRVLQQTESGLSYVQLTLETGRTHPIRVHLSEQGAPIAKDDLYGANKKIAQIKNKTHQKIIQQFPRFALHARELGFEHPRTKKWIEFKTDWPSDLADLILSLGFSKHESSF